MLQYNLMQSYTDYAEQVFWNMLENKCRQNYAYIIYS
jgi:hypothetical protein